MKNLAGDASCDKYILQELETAGIPVATAKPHTNEVPYTIMGRLGGFTFHRAWYYWVVDGPMPMWLAERINIDPANKAIRVAGHCGCPPPKEWGIQIGDEEYVTTYHIDTEIGLRVFADAVKTNGLDKLSTAIRLFMEYAEARTTFLKIKDECMRRYGKLDEEEHSLWRLCKKHSEEKIAETWKALDDHLTNVKIIRPTQI
jgi:hypothetical protein